MQLVETYRVPEYGLASILPDRDSDPRGILWMWEPPSPRAVYVVGVDPTVGITGWDRVARTNDDDKVDNAAVEVLRVGHDNAPDVQVAEYVAPIDPEDLADIVNMIGRMYSGNDENGQALCIIEIYPGPGLITQRRMISNLGYTHMFVWKYLDSMASQATNSLGWTSSPKSVRDLWIRGNRHIRRKGVIINSPGLVEEMRYVRMDPHKMAGNALAGKHDDRIRAIMLASWCLPPDALVTKMNGTRIPISSVYIGSILKGLNGPERVGRIYIKDHSSHIVQFSISGQHNQLTCTPDHKILIRTVREIRSNRVRRNCAGSTLTWQEAGSVKRGDEVLIPCTFNKPRVNISQERLWFMGWYLAEGWTGRKNVVYLALGPHEVEQAERLAEIARHWILEQPKYSGSKKFKVGIKKKRTALVVSFSSPLMASFLREHCGCGARKKRLSDYLMSVSGLEPFITGWLCGDGSVYQDRARITTTSEVLALQMRQVLLDHGIWATVQYRLIKERMIEGRTLAPSDSWVVGIGKPWLRKLFGAPGEALRYQRISMVEHGFLTPITAVTKVDYSGVVYDLRTTTHTFVAGGVVVHNCAHDWTGQVETISTKTIQDNKIEPNWQASDLTVAQLDERWQEKWEEISGF